MSTGHYLKAEFDRSNALPFLLRCATQAPLAQRVQREGQATDPIPTVCIWHGFRLPATSGCPSLSLVIYSRTNGKSRSIQK
jgi:hypothetical protein